MTLHLRQQRAIRCPKAITATAHKLARIIYNIVRYGMAYQKKTEDKYAAQHRQRQEKNLHRRAKELGYELTKVVEPPPQETASAT